MIKTQGRYLLLYPFSTPLFIFESFVGLFFCRKSSIPKKDSNITNDVTSNYKGEIVNRVEKLLLGFLVGFHVAELLQTVL